MTAIQNSIFTGNQGQVTLFKNWDASVLIESYNPPNIESALEDTKRQIFSYLSVSDLGNICCVCSKFLNFQNDQILWGLLAEKHCIKLLKPSTISYKSQVQKGVSLKSQTKKIAEDCLHLQKSLYGLTKPDILHDITFLYLALKQYEKSDELHALCTETTEIYIGKTVGEIFNASVNPENALQKMRKNLDKESSPWILMDSYFKRVIDNTNILVQQIMCPNESQYKSSDLS